MRLTQSPLLFATVLASSLALPALALPTADLDALGEAGSFEKLKNDIVHDLDLAGVIYKRPENLTLKTLSELEAVFTSDADDATMKSRAQEIIDKAGLRT